MSEPLVNHVSDTALWVAIYRAMESERADPLFVDPYARRLGGSRGEQIVKSMPKGERFAWPMIVRTAVMDEIIMGTVREHGVDTILNLAAGLDARPYRLELPPTLRWFDADLPDMLSYKQEQLAGEQPKCVLETVKVDLTDGAQRTALFERVGAAAQSVLVVTEGLLVYLEPEQVTELATGLHAQPSFRWWLIDLASPRLLKMMEKTWGGKLREGGAPFRFAPAEGTAFFEPTGWREHEFRSTGEEARRLGRLPGYIRLLSLFGRLQSKARQEEMRRFSGIVTLRRA
ncbi:MAG: SAM-dependent methyltransferase [Acidobacteriota bacterium]|jgi:methyltransferase (TIGR00027 family)